MIWSWAEVATEQVESPAVHWAEMIDCSPREGPPELGPGRAWAECVPPQTVKKQLGKAALGRTRILGPRLAEASQAECPAPGKARSAEVTV